MSKNADQLSKSDNNELNHFRTIISFTVEGN